MGVAHLHNLLIANEPVCFLHLRGVDEDGQCLHPMIHFDNLTFSDLLRAITIPGVEEPNDLSNAVSV